MSAVMDEPTVNFEMPDGWGFWAVEVETDEGFPGWVFHTNFGPLILATAAECSRFAESLWAEIESSSAAVAMDLVSGHRMPRGFGRRSA